MSAESITAALQQGFPNTQHLHRLATRLKALIVDTGDEQERAAAIAQEAVRREPGVVYKSLVTTEEVSDRRSILAVDDELQSYYGYVTSALQELYQMGLARAYGESWIEYFLQDNAIYRVNVVACMCLAGAVLSSGIETRAGSPTSRSVVSVLTAVDGEDAETTSLAVEYTGTDDFEVTIQLVLP